MEVSVNPDFGKNPSLWRLLRLSDSSREDRLTEALALVLESESLSADFIHWITELEASQGEASADVNTQAPTGSGNDRIDLELRCGSEFVWIEVKLWSGPSGDDQLEKYARAMSTYGKDEGIERTLVYLTRPGEGGETFDRAKSAISDSKMPVALVKRDWSQVADWLRRRKSYLARSLAHYLAMESAMLNPVAEADLPAMLKAERVRESWWRLRAGVLERTEGEVWTFHRDTSWPKQKASLSKPEFNLNFIPDCPDWPNDFGGRYAVLEFRVKEAARGLEFRSGLTLVDEKERIEERFDLNALELMSVSGETEVTLDDAQGRLARIEIIRPIAELESLGIEEQIVKIARWVSESFQQLSSAALEADLFEDGGASR